MSENVISKINQQRYDHIFKIVFGDKKELLSLYNALSDKDYDNPDDLIINTLEDAVYIGMKMYRIILMLNFRVHLLILRIHLM